MNKFVSGIYGVEIPLVSTSTKIYLPDIAYLRGKRIKHIDVVEVLKSPAGIASLSRNFFDSAYLTIVELNTQSEQIRNLPVSSLATTRNRLFINRIADFPRSYIDVSKIAGADKTNKCIYLVFYFDDSAVWGIVPAENNRTQIQPLELKLTGKKTFFNFSSVLQNRRVQNIILNYPDTTPTGNAGLDYSNSGDKYLTLSRNQRESFKDVPLRLFLQTDQNYPLLLQNIMFDLQQSYITTVNTTADDLVSVFFNLVIDDNLIVKSKI
ncbi:MAG: hypothetical protein QM751_12925 [Paludibacteraceae bacterium]